MAKKKVKKATAHKPSKTSSGSGSSKYKHKNRTGNITVSAPFNTQPMNKKQQSRSDKVAFLRSKGVTGKAASKMAKSGKKLSQSLRQRKFKNHDGKKGAGGKKGSKKKIVIRLPEHIPNEVNTPWSSKSEKAGSKDESISTSSSSSSSLSSSSSSRKRKKKPQILPSSYYSLPEETIACFQNELQSFANYIRLTPHEINARNSVIQYITNLSHATWDKHVKIQPFGSFATLDVCTFQSDVDLALWNVVSGEEENVSAYISLNESDGSSSSDEDGEEEEEEAVFGEKAGVIMSESSLQRTMDALMSGGKMNGSTAAAKRKKERVDEWKKMLQEVDLDNEDGGSDATDDHVNVKETAIKQEDDEETNDLFVIDRQGVPSIDVLETEEEKGISDTEKESPLETTTKVNAANTMEVQVIDTKEEPRNKNENVQPLSDTAANVEADTNKDVKGERTGDESPNVNTVKSKDAGEQTKNDASEQKDSNTTATAKTDSLTQRDLTKSKEEDIQDGPKNIEEQNSGEHFDFVIDRNGIQELGGDLSEDESKSDSREEENFSESREVIVIDDSSDDDDEDSVDKMDMFYRRQHAAEIGREQRNETTKNQKQRGIQPEFIDVNGNPSKEGRGMSKRQRKAHKIFKTSIHGMSTRSRCSSASANDFESLPDSNFELNISNSTDFGSSATCKEQKTIGPKGKIRTKVIKALSLMGKKLWKSPFAQNIHIRKHARVPIICMTTRYGFDSDVALGGHNGTDTSHYVRKLVEKFDSFATVVLFLKILLQQADLDKPFTGGLGSYKLYVLVANHFNSHKSLGGGTSAAEILVSFFYRYSVPKKSNSKARTYLSKNATISSENGEADLSPVSVEHCTQLFQLCFQRIMDYLADYKEDGKSLVASLIDMMKIKRERNSVLNQTKLFKSENISGQGRSSAKKGHTFTKSTSSVNASGSSDPASSKKKQKGRAEDAAPSASQKKQRRSSRGALIPKRRIDLEMKLDGMDALLQRGAKKRKNKKKQNRDIAITEFVMRTIS